MPRNTSSKSGFALLMSLIVVSVVVSVALTLIELTIKQLRLSTGSRDSESAFHAANAIVECMGYWRFENSTEFENGTGNNVDVKCFGVGPTNPSVENIFSNAENQADYYEIQFDWGAGINRCSEAGMVVVAVDPTAAGDYTVTKEIITSHLPGYNGEDLVCPPGGRCTIISALGYNQPCGNIVNLGTVQREILVEL